MRTSLSVAMPASLCRLLHGRTDIAENTCSFRGKPAGYALEGTGAGIIDTHYAPVQAVSALAVMSYFCTALPVTIFSTDLNNHQDINDFTPDSLSDKHAVWPVPIRPQA